MPKPFNICEPGLAFSTSVLHVAPMVDARFTIARSQLSELFASDPDAASAITTEVVNLIRTLQFEKPSASLVLLQEREIIADRVRDFCCDDSRPWKFFVERGWHQLSMKEYVGIGQVLACEANLEIDREAKRKKPVLLKWMDDNWDTLSPLLMHLRLELDPT
jgi:hypothetical protein